MKEDPEKPSLGASLGKARLDRLNMGGQKGSSAMVVGFALVGPVIGGFLIGWWLDEKLGTGYWTIIIGLLGVFGGFREMFVLLKRLQPGPMERTPPPGREKTTVKPAPRVEVDESPKPRLFSVPPPPIPGSVTTGAPDVEVPDEPETPEALLRRLMGETEDDEDVAEKDVTDEDKKRDDKDVKQE